MVFQAGPVASIATGSASKPASCALRAPSSARALPASAPARSSSVKAATLVPSPYQPYAPRSAVGCHTVTTRALLLPSRRPALLIACFAVSDPS
jgi:hypothetical protein